MQRELPRWALALTPPGVAETPYDLPSPPPALPVPGVARAVERSDAAPRATDVVSAPIVAPGETVAGVPGAAPGGAPAGPAGGAGPAPRPRQALAERLRPGHGDPRLWMPLPEEIVGLSGEQLAQLEMDLAIAEVVDSIEAAEATGRRATDWTYTDSQGRRWGVAPGRNGMVNLYVGGITIPLPFGFSAPRTADASRRMSQDAQIAAQADRAVATTVLKDRAAEIRKRRDAERARARPAPRSDTIGGG